MFFQNLWLNFAKRPGNFVKGWQKNDICVFSSHSYCIPWHNMAHKNT